MSLISYYLNIFEHILIELVLLTKIWNSFCLDDLDFTENKADLYCMYYRTFHLEWTSIKAVS